MVQKPKIPPFQFIVSFEHLFRSWCIFKSGKEQKRDVAGFAMNVISEITSLSNDLRLHQYVHGAYTHFVISDPKRRDIHKSSVRDRVLHHALYAGLYPYFDSRFIYDSYSCRIGKGTHRAVRRFERIGNIVSKNNTSTVWVLKCDIRKFFASIDHEILKSILIKHGIDEEIIQLLDRVIDSFHSEKMPCKGLPLGNLTSQLLVNVYMNEFDHFMKYTLKVGHYIRYADDFVVFSKNKAYLESLVQKIAVFLEQNLKLSLHPEKISIKTLASGIDFLGWIHFPHHRILRTNTKNRMIKRLKNINAKTSTVQSYLGFLAHGNTYNLQKSMVDQIKMIC